MKIYDRIRILRKAYNMELDNQFRLRDRFSTPTIADLNQPYGLSRVKGDIRRSVAKCKQMDTEIDYLTNKLQQQ